MKRSILLILCLSLLVGCSMEIYDRKVTVIIPEHPWEYYAGAALWYSLQWNYGGEIKELFVDAKTREVVIGIKPGETVVIAAYPLGQMHPFGGAVTPLSNSLTVQLDQNSGYLANLLLDIDINIIERLNWQKIIDRCNSMTDDYRYIDDLKFVQDVLNGELKASSFSLTKPIEINSLSMLSGTWISENLSEPRLIVSSKDMPSLVLPAGVHRYFNKERDIEMRLVVSSDSVFKYEKQGLVPY